ncbi:MAG TPA: hypothetical protein VFG83_03175 [Kofleriaceae bacterium]|nr:hypothetical protein [Kofleriaceae bacterium]
MTATRCARCGQTMPADLGRTMLGGAQAPVVSRRGPLAQPALMDDDDATIIDTAGPEFAPPDFPPYSPQPHPGFPPRGELHQGFPQARPPQQVQPQAQPRPGYQPPAQPGFQPQAPQQPQPGFQPQAPQQPQPGFQPQAPQQPQPGFQPGTDPLFQRDVFLLRQKMIAISEKYHVSDEHGRPIIYVERPAHLARNLAAVLAATAVLIGILLGGVLTAGAIGGGAGIAIALIAAIIAVPAMLAVLALLAAKRHIGFFRDPSKAQPLLHVSQDKKVELFRFTYTVRDPGGAHLATFYKNRIFDLFRRRWTWFSPQGQVLCVAKEDSIARAIARRLLGNLGLLLFRTNFIFLYQKSDHQIGMFNRTATILDRYALDLRADYAHTLDRRIALALGVVLDTGERR